MKLEKINVFDKTGFRPIIYKDIKIESTLPPTPPVIETTQIVEEVPNNDKKTTTETATLYEKDKVVYKVQVEKTNPTLPAGYVQRLSEMGINKEVLKNQTVYTKGSFMNSIDAIKMVRELKAKGVKIAFPIAILNGEKIPLQQGIDFQKAQIQNK
jgi:hypothetical protein